MQVYPRDRLEESVYYLELLSAASLEVGCVSNGSPGVRLGQCEWARSSEDSVVRTSVQQAEIFSKFEAPCLNFDGLR